MFGGKLFTDLTIAKSQAQRADTDCQVDDRQPDNPLQQEFARYPSFRKRIWFGFALTYWSRFELIL
jgi:hypothetical protein